jgi:hypothetical protein
MLVDPTAPCSPQLGGRPYSVVSPRVFPPGSTDAYLCRKLGKDEAPMIGSLAPQEIEDVLEDEVLGRIACIADGHP